MNLSFSGKQRLLRGLLDGPIVIGNTTLIPHHGLETEDALEEIIKHTRMSIHHNQPLLEFLSDKHETSSMIETTGEVSGMKSAAKHTPFWNPKQWSSVAKNNAGRPFKFD